MTETGKFLQRRAVLAGAVVIPLAAISAVVLQDDAWIPEQCDGCREIFRMSELTAGDAGTRWCSACREDTAPPAPAFDCVEEDDTEL
jgi:hypothetical protein